MKCNDRILQFLFVSYVKDISSKVSRRKEEDSIRDSIFLFFFFSLSIEAQSNV